MTLAKPHGGTLKELLVAGADADVLRGEALRLPTWDLNLRQLCDVELIVNGGFSPLGGFHTEGDYERVLREMRLGDGTLWPVPITLDVTEDFAQKVSKGARVALLHPEGMALAVLTVTDIWRPDVAAEAKAVFGTSDDAHPGVFHLNHQTHPVRLGGPLQGLELPPHHTFQAYRYTPGELRREFQKLGWSKIVAFQTRNPMHRAHAELVKRAARDQEACLLIHPSVGQTRPGDVDYFSRARCYKAILRHFPQSTTMLSLLPLAMRMAGPREALWHAIIRKNYGCSHFIVGRDHAGPGNDSSGKPFHGPYDAQELAKKHEAELGITILPFEEMVYVEERAEYMPMSEVPKGARVLSISGTELRRRLKDGLELPAWFSYPEVVAELRRSFPPRAAQGFTVFFTGLSGSGKSTIANVLLSKLLEVGTRPVTLLDGDLVRKHLSSELGFTKKDRDLNITRIGFVASEITKNRGVAVCAPIAPYAAARRIVREMIGQYGGFIEVFVDTPIEVCESRDRKGLYAKARAGLLKGFTGIDDPYERPENPELVIDTSKVSAEEAAQAILLHLRKEGYLSVEEVESAPSA
jgi:sulfate adenylyltransferase